jgi:hypothetical protein
MDGARCEQEFGGIGWKNAILYSQTEDGAQIPTEMIDEAEGEASGGFLLQVPL